MTDRILSPKESGEFIAKNSKKVRVFQDKIEEASAAILKSMEEVKYSMKTWKMHSLHPKEMTEATANWILVVDSLNFSFWVKEEQEPFMVKFHEQLYSDYEALCAIVNRALEDNIALTSPKYYQSITLSDAKFVFRSATSTPIPLLEKRVEHLQEAGGILCSNYSGSVVELIKSCNHSALLLVQKIVSEFASFRDEGMYETKRVSFYKRAQIFVADIWACFEGQGFGQFDDISELTMFADYRVPQCLQLLGIIDYSEELRRKICKEEISPGSEEELEIRGCSIYAVECLRDAMKSQIKQGGISTCISCNDLNSVIVDFYLWDFATSNSDQLKQFPEHHTRTHFY